MAPCGHSPHTAGRPLRPPSEQPPSVLSQPQTTPLCSPSGSPRCRQVLLLPRESRVSFLKAPWSGSQPSTVQRGFPREWLRLPHSPGVGTAALSLRPSREPTPTLPSEEEPPPAPGPLSRLLWVQVTPMPGPTSGLARLGLLCWSQVPASGLSARGPSGYGGVPRASATCSLWGRSVPGRTDGVDRGPGAGGWGRGSGGRVSGAGAEVGGQGPRSGVGCRGWGQGSGLGSWVGDPGSWVGDPGSGVGGQRPRSGAGGRGRGSGTQGRLWGCGSGTQGRGSGTRGRGSWLGSWVGDPGSGVGVGCSRCFCTAWKAPPTRSREDSGSLAGRALRLTRHAASPV